MGYYIPGPAVGKGECLVWYHGARARTEEEARAALLSDDVAPICVVMNGPFEAAALAYSEEEFDCFADPNDRRPKQWYVMDRAKAYELSGIKG